MKKHLVLFSTLCILLVLSLAFTTGYAQKGAAGRKKAAKGGKKAESKDFTSDFHKKNAGKVLFSKKPIVIGKEDPAQFTDTFSSTDRIYGMAYLDAVMGKDLNVDNRMNIDGFMQHVFIDIPESYKGKAYCLIEIIPDPEKAIHTEDAVKFMKVLGRLETGEHTVDWQFKVARIKATGQFKLNWSDADVEKLQADAALSAVNAENNIAKIRQLPEIFSKPEGSFDDPQLSNGKLKALCVKGLKDCKEVIKIHIGKDNATNDWRVKKNALGIPEYMGTNHSISVAYKANDGWCYYLEHIAFKKEYLGDGNYGAVQLARLAPEWYHKIDCANVK